MYAEGREILLHTRTVFQQAPDKTHGDKEVVAPYDLMHAWQASHGSKHYDYRVAFQGF